MPASRAVLDEPPVSWPPLHRSFGQGGRAVPRLHHDVWVSVRERLLNIAPTCDVLRRSGNGRGAPERAIENGPRCFYPQIFWSSTRSALPTRTGAPCKIISRKTGPVAARAPKSMSRSPIESEQPAVDSHRRLPNIIRPAPARLCRSTRRHASNIHGAQRAWPVD
jgi:hypothetical protein